MDCSEQSLQAKRGTSVPWTARLITLGVAVGVISTTERADAVVADGALPMLTWEPWLPGGGVDQPEYAMARIAAGDHDDHIAAFADQIRDWGGRLALRFAHELDAPHYPWSVGVNGNTAEDVVAAWHHVREVFAERDADVVWVWCVNVHAAGTAEYALLYPSDDGGDALPWGGWRSPGEVFGGAWTTCGRCPPGRS
jgi:hypothetical protein